MGKTSPDSAAARFLLSDTLARSGEAAQARQELQRAVQLDRLYLPARAGEIKMLVRAGDLQNARQKLDKLRTDFGEQTEVLGIEGSLALGTGDAAKAEELFSAALKKRPDGGMAILLARSQLLQTKTDAGLGVLEAWLKVHPQDLAVLMELAGSHLALARDDEAMAGLRPHPRELSELRPGTQQHRLATSRRGSDQGDGVPPSARRISPRPAPTCSTYWPC